METATPTVIRRTTYVKNPWSFSTTYGANPGYKVSCVDTSTGRDKRKLDGQTFDSQEAATQAGLDAGVLGYCVSYACSTTGCNSSELVFDGLTLEGTQPTGSCWSHNKGLRP